eukprot:750871-Hanusia_phi.AAC.1
MKRRGEEKRGGSKRKAGAAFSRPAPAELPARPSAIFEMKSEMDDVPLVASEGVGSGGVGHFCSGKVSVFRLPPPIPGKEGGGYPAEWHHAQIVIRRNYMMHKLRNAGKKVSEAPDSKVEGDESQKSKMRKRDLIKKYADSGLSFIKGVADKVSHNETLQKTAGKVGHVVSEAHAYTGKLVHGLAHKKHEKSGETGEIPLGEETNRYPGWMMERIKTASIGVGFFLKRSSRSYAWNPALITVSDFLGLGKEQGIIPQKLRFSLPVNKSASKSLKSMLETN